MINQLPEDQSFKSIVATGELHTNEPLTTHWMLVSEVAESPMFILKNFQIHYMTMESNLLCLE